LPASLILRVAKQKFKMVLQKVFWIHLTDNRIIRSISDFKTVRPQAKCKLMPITEDNCHRVGDFREKSRIPQYRDKLVHGEIGYFAEHNGRIIGSHWATVNKTGAQKVVRTYMKLLPNEGLLHDLVIDEKCRGMGVGPFMVSELTTILFREHGVSRIIWDISIRNGKSLRMIEKLGVPVDHRMLALTVFRRLVFHLVFRKQ